MNDSDFVKEMKDKIKWMKESEYKDMLKKSKSIDDIHSLIYTDKFTKFLELTTVVMVKDNQVEEGVKIMEDILDISKDKHNGPFILALAFLITHSLARNEKEVKMFMDLIDHDVG